MKILFSDLHLAPFRREKFLTQKKNFFEIIIQYFAKKFEKKDKEEKMLNKIRKIIKHENIKKGYFNGDFMEARRTERGMNTSEDLNIACRLRNYILQKLGLEEGEFNLGNHESGYDLPLSTDEERGINRKAIDNFLLFAGRHELYHSFCEDGLRFIFIPYIFSEDRARDFNLKAEKRKFIIRLKQDLSKNIPTILLVHDPDSFDDATLLKVIRKNRDKIKFIFYGHYHSWINLTGMRILIAIYTNKWLYLVRQILNRIFLKLAKGDERIVNEMGKYFRKRKNIPALIKELDAILTPAPTGTFGIGGGYLVLDSEKKTVKKYNL